MDIRNEGKHLQRLDCMLHLRVRQSLLWRLTKGERRHRLRCRLPWRTWISPWLLRIYISRSIEVCRRWIILSIQAKIWTYSRAVDRSTGLKIPKNWIGRPLPASKEGCIIQNKSTESDTAWQTSWDLFLPLQRRSFQPRNPLRRAREMQTWAAPHTRGVCSRSIDTIVVLALNNPEDRFENTDLGPRNQAKK